MRLVQQPILVLGFHDLFLDAIDDAQRDEEVVAVRTEVLARAVEATRCVDGG